MVKEVDNEIWNTNAITIGVSDAEKNWVNNKWILSNIFGKCLLSGLVLLAQNKVKIESDDYKRTLDNGVYIDGAVVYWVIPNLTQPNNDCVSKNLLEELWRLHIKSFRFSVKNMLARFKELCIKLDGKGV